MAMLALDPLHQNALDQCAKHEHQRFKTKQIKASNDQHSETKPYYPLAIKHGHGKFPIYAWCSQLETSIDNRCLWDFPLPDWTPMRPPCPQLQRLRISATAVWGTLIFKMRSWGKLTLQRYPKWRPFKNCLLHGISSQKGSDDTLQYIFKYV